MLPIRNYLEIVSSYITIKIGMNLQKLISINLQVRYRPDLICEKLRGIPRDVFRFMLIGSLSATDS